MKLSDAEHAASLVARRLGLPVRAVLTAHDRLLLAPSEIDANEGFGIEVRTSWRSAEAQFVPGPFSRPLIEKMGQASPAGRVAFVSLGRSAMKHGKITFRVNGISVDLRGDAMWPERWDRLELAYKRQGIVFEDLTDSEFKHLLEDMVAPLFGMCIALIEVDEVSSDEIAREGGSVHELSVRYERRPINREICLSTRGRRCYCCGIDFGEVYGALADGYIEVHHIVPASQIGPDYEIDPVAELVPLCSNCHSVVHLTNPPRSVDEIKALFKSEKQG